MDSIHDEGIWNQEKFRNPPVIDNAFIENAIQFVLKRIDKNLEIFTEQFPSPASVNNVYQLIDNVKWTSAFWTGMVWLAYEITGDEKYLKAAEKQLVSYRQRVDEKVHANTHDLGFLYTLSSVASYKLTGNENAKSLALDAADLLSRRYLEKAGIIQAWGELSSPVQRGRMIIDCCMNLPLLYWASEQTDNKRYHEIACNHIHQVAKYIIRKDASSYHTFYMDDVTGEPKYGKTHQGFSDDSCWARGQAWAMYGFPLSYKYTRDMSLIETATKVSNYFLNRIPDDYICYWDLIYTDGTEARDSSAAAIAACGLFEISKNLAPADPRLNTYVNAALHIVKSLSDNYTTIKIPESNGVLQHGVYNKPTGEGVDECCIWGDYFYFEALVRMKKNWDLFW